MRGMALRRLALLASLAGALLPGAAFADDSAPAAPPAEAPAAAPEPITPAEPAAAPAPQVATETAAPKQQTAPKKDTTRRSRKARRQPLTWSGPVATLPSFRVLPDGRTRIVVRVSGNIDVGEARTDLRAVYLLRGVGTIARENRLPLLTSYFRSPVTRVELVQQDSGVGLVIDLREAAAPTFRVEAVPGGMELVVELPKPRETAAQLVGDAARERASEPSTSQRIGGQADTEPDTAP
jgi:hypothetical protein